MFLSHLFYMSYSFNDPGENIYTHKINFIYNKSGNRIQLFGRSSYFFVWLRDTKDPDFLRKFNLSTLAINPWSFDGAIKHVLGEEYNIDELWHEYQIAMGDITDDAPAEI